MLALGRPPVALSRFVAAGAHAALEVDQIDRRREQRHGGREPDPELAAPETRGSRSSSPSNDGGVGPERCRHHVLREPRPPAAVAGGRGARAGAGLPPGADNRGRRIARGSRFPGDRRASPAAPPSDRDGSSRLYPPADRTLPAARSSDAAGPDGRWGSAPGPAAATTAGTDAPPCPAAVAATRCSRCPAGRRCRPTAGLPGSSAVAAAAPRVRRPAADSRPSRSNWILTSFLTLSRERFGPVERRVREQPVDELEQRLGLLGLAGDAQRDPRRRRRSRLAASPGPVRG